MIGQLRAAVDALNQGDPKPFTSLLADDWEWRGLTSGHLWWKQTPVCHGPAEALEVMKVGIAKRAQLGLSIEPLFEQVDENTVIGWSEWVGDDGRRQTRYQVLRFRDGKIVDMQGCASRADAERFARQPT
jgi:ketosteroid isomerase-like protein